MAFRVLLLLLAALTFALAGCGNDVSDEGTGATATEASTDETGETGDTGETADTGETEEEGGGEGDAENGSAIFASAGCAGCHTLAAANATGNVGPNLDDAQPDFDEVVAMVKAGGGTMPAFEGQLSEQEINDVAAYVSENAG